MGFDKLHVCPERDENFYATLVKIITIGRGGRKREKEKKKERIRLDRQTQTS